MPSIDDHRRRIIDLTTSQHSAHAIVSASIEMWTRLASTLGSSISEDAFQSLFLRSVHMTGKIYPWIMPGHAFHAAESGFVALRTCLEERDAIASGAASASLLSAFIDILVLLLGEPFAQSILNSAWGGITTAPNEVR